MFTAYRPTVRAVRNKEWKLIRYPERNYTQLFNLNNDPLELKNLAGQPQFREIESMLKKQLERSQKESGDTLRWTASKVLPLHYDASSFVQKADVHQPDYVLKKYFPNR